jgi:hypothetical protein
MKKFVEDYAQHLPTNGAVTQGAAAGTKQR